MSAEHVLSKKKVYVYIYTLTRFLFTGFLADGAEEGAGPPAKRARPAAASNTQLLISYLQGRDEEQKEMKKEELALQRVQIEGQASERRESLALQREQFTASTEERRTMMDLMKTMMETMKRPQ